MTRLCPEPDCLPDTFRAYFSACIKILPGLEVYVREEKQVQSVLALVQTGTIDKNTLPPLLSSDEKQLFSNYSYPKRQKEWLGGRMSCKYAVLKLLDKPLSPEHFKSISILPGDNGVPELSFQNCALDLPAISISHSGKYAVAFAGFAQSCGIDIQQVSPKTLNVVSHFATPAEVQLLEANTSNMNEQQRLTLLWSAKEAYKKSLLFDQPSIFKGITLKNLSQGANIQVELVSAVAGGDPQPVEVTAHLLDDYVLAFTKKELKHA